MSELAQRRVKDFQQRCGEAALHLAYHAALPVALNADLLHFLRINFFLDSAETLPYTIEFELLLSPLCREIDEGLYEIEPEVRDILLAGLAQKYDEERIRDVATLLWQYIDRFSAWNDRVELERAQQLTALNFLNPEKAQQWLSDVQANASRDHTATQEWFIAIQKDIQNQARQNENAANLNQLQNTHQQQLQADERVSEEGALDETVSVDQTASSNSLTELVTQHSKLSKELETQILDLNRKALQSAQSEWNARIEKLTNLRRALAAEANVAIQFQLERQIQSEEEEINSLENRLSEIEQDLNRDTIPTSQASSRELQNTTSEFIEGRTRDTRQLREVNNHYTLSERLSRFSEPAAIWLENNLERLAIEACNTILSQNLNVTPDDRIVFENDICYYLELVKHSLEVIDSSVYYHPEMQNYLSLLNINLYLQALEQIKENACRSSARELSSESVNELELRMDALLDYLKAFR